MFTRPLLIAAAFALTAGASFAQAPGAPATPTEAAVAHQDRRDIRQENRIQAGKADGSLTPHEANRLQREQTHIARVEQKDAADGRVTPREAAHVQKLQNRASRHIYKQKHDAQRTVASTK